MFGQQGNGWEKQKISSWDRPHLREYNGGEGGEGWPEWDLYVILELLYTSNTILLLL